MSRVKLTPKNPEHEVVVGLDRPLSTFFISVTRVQADDDLRDFPAIEFKDRWRREDVLEKIKQYAVQDTRTRYAYMQISLDNDPAAGIEAFPLTEDT